MPFAVVAFSAFVAFVAAVRRSGGTVDAGDLKSSEGQPPRAGSNPASGTTNLHPSRPGCFGTRSPVEPEWETRLRYHEDYLAIEASHEALWPFLLRALNRSCDPTGSCSQP